jgi:hypothetical protein
MKRKKSFFALISSLIAAVASYFVSQYLSHIFFDFNFNSVTKSDVELSFSFTLFLLCFLFLFTLISLPFLFSAFLAEWKINKHNWWKAIIVLEIVGLIIAYATTPPDLISTIILFVLWQLSIVVNVIALVWMTRKSGS